MDSPPTFPRASGTVRKDLKQAIRAGDLLAVQNIVTSPDNQDHHAHSEILGLGLLISSQSSKIPILEYLLGQNADPNYVPQQDTNRPFPLMAALESGDDRAVQLLLEKGADVSIRTNKGKTMLMLAKSSRSAELLLQHNINVDSVDPDGRTALMQVSQPFMVDLLVKHGASIDLPDKNGYTALYIALKEREDDTIAGSLIRNDADIEAADIEGRTILDTAVWKGRVEVLEMLKLRDVDFLRQDGRGRNVLHHLASDDARSDEEDALISQAYPNDERILNILLDSGIDPDAGDKIQRTCLHWAAATGNSALVRRLLSHKRKPNIEAIEHKQRTPLHLAASKGHTRTMEALFDHHAEVNATSGAALTPLHAACDRYWDSSKTVGLLLKHNADPSRKTRSGKTALHLAAQAGNRMVVQLLLQSPKVDRAARDVYGNTPLLSAASFLQHLRKELELKRSRKSPPQEGQSMFGGKSNDKMLDDLIAIQSLLAPWNNGNALRQEAKLAAQKVRSTIYEFGEHLKRGHVHDDTKTVYQLLYEADAKDASIPAIKTTYKNPQVQQFRWIHLPANNISWCHDLLTKHFIERDSKDVDGFKDLERSLNHQHRGQKLHSHYMTPTCQTILRPWRTDTPSRTNTIDSNPDDDLTETPAESAIRPVPTHYYSSPLDQHQSTQWRKIITNGPKKKPSQVQESEDTAIDHLYIFMPYIHSETVDNMRQMHRIAGEAYASDNGTAIDLRNSDQLHELSSMSLDEVLLRAHLNRFAPSLHMRRTLDQSFYHNLNTIARDSSGQVVHRYQDKVLKKSEAHQTVLMVDQLWIWVLNDELVVSSFPAKWGQPLNDSMNVLESIKEYINSNNQGRVRSVYELAMMITSHCSRAYHRHGLVGDDEQYLDMFEGSIGIAMDREVALFRSFDRQSEKARRWMHNSDNMERGRSPPFISELLNINSETALLKEIKDIHDELEMWDMICSHQAKVLPIMQEAIESICEQKDRPLFVKQRYKKAFEEQKRAVIHPREDIERMIRQVFTLVTVIFLPLSFIAAFLAIDISDFPKNDAGELPIDFVITYTFGIGLPIAAIAVILARYIGSIKAWLSSKRETTTQRSNTASLHRRLRSTSNETLGTRQVTEVLPASKVHRRLNLAIRNHKRGTSMYSSSAELEHMSDGAGMLNDGDGAPTWPPSAPTAGPDPEKHGSKLKFTQSGFCLTPWHIARVILRTHSTVHTDRMPAISQCCATGSLHAGTPKGELTKLHGLDCYVTNPPSGAPKGIIVIIPDAFGIALPNNRILADAYAEKVGAQVLLPDFMNDVMISFNAMGATGFWNQLYKFGHFLYLLRHFPPFLIYNRAGVATPRILSFFKSLRDNEAKDLPVGTAEKTSSGKRLVDCGYTAHPSSLKYPGDIEMVVLPLSISAPEHDIMMPPKEAKRTEEILKAKTAKTKDQGVEHDFVLYPEAPHGFAVRAAEDDVKQAELGKKAEAQAVAWFSKWFANPPPIMT
nr:ankyrin repeat and protein kinase domain-containing protein 1 [Quercus suber]